MNLSDRHQKTFDEAYPKGLVVRDDEKGYFHIMFIDIRKDGERTRDVPVFQKYSEQEWRKMKQVFETHNIKAVTGHSEYAVIHDPTAVTREVKAKPDVKKASKVKPEAKAKPASSPK